MPINEKNLNRSLSDRNNAIETAENVAPKKGNSVAQEILETNRENHRLLKKIVRYQRMETIFSLLKILFVIVPLVFAYIYLAPMLSQAIKNYQDLLGTTNSLQSATVNLKDLENVDLSKQLKEMQELFK